MEELPTGFRFYPTEEELISFYLHNKLEDKSTNINRVIPIVDIYQLDPWDLPKQCGELCNGDTEQWFFFTPRQEREVRGGRPSRTTASGYWKATGSPSYVFSSDNKVIGVKKSMVFYKGKAPTGRKTKWKMNEYRAIKEDSQTSAPKLMNELSLCRVYIVSGSCRAFDRRPVYIGESSSSREVKITQENGEGIVGNSGMLLERRGSSESLASGENYDVENVGETADGLENLMEWEDF
ncbi:hypothetical protein CDL12_06581 [Handroanthus impetiginosus]|uniref:NAC domain-containing protein n=1 Tax=Handroanthus impetiginosus TaxID=429701 RepID=A0A2G9HT77_9LAMI|nr:hypothetical protein CDL12_06581 [Handroanthus impetiginosus]